MLLLLRAAALLCAALCAHAARAERHDGLAEAAAVPRAKAGAELNTTSPRAEHFQKTVAQTSQIKDAVERVHVKTQAAKEAAVAVKDSFGQYQGTITALKGQLDRVDGAASQFEGELLEHLAGDEAVRLQPFEEYQPQFGGARGAGEVAVPHADGAGETNVSNVKIGDIEDAGEPPMGASLSSAAGENTTAELSFLEGGRRSRQANATAEDKPKETTAPKTEVHSSGTAAGETPSAGASGGNRFEKSVQQSGQIKAAVGKVKDKVELTRQAAVKVKQGFEDYKGKVVEMKNQLAEVDKQQHEYHEKLLGHFDGEESDRMSAFDNAPSLESEGSSNATAAASGLLQARERLQPSKEHVKVSAGGSLHAARH